MVGTRFPSWPSDTANPRRARPLPEAAEVAAMTDFTKYLPSDEEIGTAWRVGARLIWNEQLQPVIRFDPEQSSLRALILAAVQRAVAEETFAMKQRAIECAARSADMETRHAREIDRARSLLKSLVEHEEIVGGSLVQLSTSYRLAKAALAALDGEDE